MSIKSLSITEDAYEALKAMKHGDESFSEVVLKLSRASVGAAARFFGVWKNRLETVKHLQDHIKTHRAELDRQFAERQQRMFRPRR